ncbi:MAG: NAD(P)-binding domain-containing protein [Myxococcota bacterium]|jgi:3-hydroxyisobutyrate dehydrogenase-like beta-hydroxyacid dehydrogenase|nr:NAD(P)-binding domain-containing protein [Myxococcota bacterium]
MVRAYLGTGLIGEGLALAALGRGERVRAWNRTADKTRSIVAAGGEALATPEEAVAGVTIVHLALTADAAVDALLDRIADHVGDAIVVDHSTTSPEGARARVDSMKARGVRFLHCPVFMSPAACRAAQGVMLASGPREVFDAAAPWLSETTGVLLFAGEEGHRAATLKLAGNGMILAMIGGLADVFTMATAQGVDPNDVLGLFQDFDLRNVLRARGAKMAAGDYGTAWTLAMARKDQGLMVDAAQGRALAVLPAIGARMDTLIAEGEGEKDLAVLARDVRGTDV